MLAIGQKVKFELAKNDPIYPRWNIAYDRGPSGNYLTGEVIAVSNAEFRIRVPSENYTWTFLFSTLGAPGAPKPIGKKLKVKENNKPIFYVKLIKTIKEVGKAGDVFAATRPIFDDFATVNLIKDKNRKRVFQTVSWLEVDNISKSAYYRNSKKI